MRNTLKVIGLMSLVMTVGIGQQIVAPHSQSAIAQVAETPNPETNGDFNTAILSGNMGNYYANNQWLVMPQADTGVLNCRQSPNGPVVARIAEGAIVQAIFDGPLQTGDRGTPLNSEADAIDLSTGKPWLHVDSTGYLFFPPVGGSNSQSTSCYVRANLQYIAPINAEANIAF